jgi:hypothetical protein
MNTLNNQTPVKSHLENAKTALSIILILGWILLIIGIINEGFAADTIIWLLALVDGSMFWVFMRKFMEYPTQAGSKTLSTIFKSFVFVWILAVAVSYLIWGTLYTVTILAIMLLLVASYFMNQFISESKTLLT